MTRADRKLYSNETTSREAAETLDPGVKQTMLQRVYDYICEQGERGATDQEMRDGLGIDGDTIRPRRTDLWNKGLIRKAPFERTTAANKRAQVWIAVR